MTLNADLDMKGWRCITTVFHQITVPGAEANNKPLPLSDFDEIRSMDFQVHKP